MEKALIVEDMEDIKNKKFIEKAVDKFNGFLGLSFDDNQKENEPKMEARSSGNNGISNIIFSIPFDGEKNLGEIGPIRDYQIEYDALRLRSWQSYIESEITQTVIGKFCKWVIGKGLKLQSEPIKSILLEEGLDKDFDFAKLSKNIESKFLLYSQSKNSSYSGMESLGTQAKTAFLNAKIGGDVLVVIRLVEGVPKIEIIDGEHIRTFGFTGNEHIPQKLKSGNFIINGIEMNSRKEHIAYHIAKRGEFKSVRIKAKTKMGLTQAFMVYGLRYRLHNNRGLPLISAVMETLKKMERYKEAAVGSAEERQKIPYTIEHGVNSTGENPLSKGMAKAFDANAGNDELPKDIAGRDLANTIAVTTNKNVWNMPNDSKLQSLESNSEIHFTEFYTTNINLVCASIGIPPEVAMSKYDSNFSASRAALKDWEHTIGVERHSFKEQFYDPIYKYWFAVEVLKNKISAPLYLTSGINSDIRNSYEFNRFIGAGVPHIDPLKEVKAVREKLGPLGKDFPLTTVEKATEELNTGDSEQNFDQFVDEVEKLSDSGIVQEEEVVDKPPIEET